MCDVPEPHPRADRSKCVGLVIGFVGVVALLGIDLRSKTEELLGAGAVLAYSTGSNRQPSIIGTPGSHPPEWPDPHDRYRARVAVAVTGVA